MTNDGKTVKIVFSLEKEKVRISLAREIIFNSVPPPRYIIIFQIPGLIKNPAGLSYTWFLKTWKNYRGALVQAREEKRETEEQFRRKVNFIILPSCILNLPLLEGEKK